MGDRGDPPAVVAHDGELPHLGHRDEPLVGGVVLGGGVQQQHVLGPVDPGEVEVAQAPQVEPAPHHRVHAAHQVVLEEAPGRGARGGEGGVVVGPEGEVGDVARTAGGDGQGDAACALGEAEGGQPVAQGARRLVGLLGQPGPRQVEVDHHLVVGGGEPDLVVDGGDERAVRRQLVDRADGGHEVGGALVQHVVGDGEGPAVDREGAHAVEGVLAVVPADQHLEHRLGARQLALEAFAEELHDLLGDRGEGLDAGGAVRGVGVVGEVGHLGLHVGEHRGPLGVDEGLVEPAEADAAGEVADDGEPQLGGQHEAVERVAHHAVEGCGRARLGRPPLEQGGRDGDVGGRAPLGEEDAEDGVVELAGAVEGVDAVVLEHPAQLAAELLGEASAVGVEGAQVGVEELPR